MYAALESSCFCRICANEMMQKTENTTMYTNMRRRAERDRMARYEINGIRAVPFDGKLARWQASITGPANSPYEGGTFFLYVYMPHKCVQPNEIYDRSTSQFFDSLQLSVRTASH